MPEIEKKQSAVIEKVNSDYNTSVNSGTQVTKVYKALLDKKIEEKTEWMINVAEKAAIQYEQLKTVCDKATNIKPDVIQYLVDGKVVPSYSEKVWKEKTEPFQKLEKLSEQFDKALTEGTVVEFEKLEKLLK